MDWLNYHHLMYFWLAAREGSVSRAAERLHLAQPTVSSQIRKLEQSVGSDLFERSGRKLLLTETGQLVYRFADEIFGLGQELQEVLRDRDREEVRRLLVGVPDVLPKLVVYRLLQPALRLDLPIQLVCYEGKQPDLLAELALLRLDVVLADAPLAAETRVRAFNHLLGECGITVFGTPELAKRYRRDFPQSLHQAPLLLPTQNTSLRRQFEQWLDQRQWRPRVIHEFEDSAILKVFGQEGHGLFLVPTAIEKEVARQYAVRVVGRIPEIVERYYAISVERRLKHPAVVAISEAARTELFAPLAT